VEASERIKVVGELLRFWLDDHIVVAGDEFVSAL
jgi:hypothetical protein